MIPMDRIEINPEVCIGRPVTKGTRYTDCTDVNKFDRKY